MEKHHIQIGDRFGRWEVISEVFKKQEGQRSRPFVLCKCACGNHGEIKIYDLTYGKSQSCGCFKDEMTTKRNTTHGWTKRNKKLYQVWHNMMQRCYNADVKDYLHYGARGIIVCPEFHDVDCFCKWALSADYSPELEIDRINVDGPYSPNNCRFVTHRENNNNQRKTMLVTAFGETKSLTEWTNDPRSVVACANTIRHRLHTLHWPSEKALTTPGRQSIVSVQSHLHAG